MLWIPLTVVAAAFQVARNAAQRGLIGGAGPWGATLVRFLFGFPFALAFAVVAWLVAGRPAAHFAPAFFAFVVTGALSQVVATAALLVAMNRAGFAVGTALQQSSLPLAGVLGWLVFGDRLSPHAWIGVGVVTAGVAALSWPQGGLSEISGERPVSGAMFGLLSGLCFGFSLNAFRHATLLLAPRDLAFSATATVAFTQAIQSAALGGWLAVRRPAALESVLASWRESLFAGFCGACASAAWLFALALAPAASVRAVGVVESPMAAAAGRRLFAEKLSARKLAAGALVGLGVVLTALG
ncbi:MAG TPA: DMT family transporter [Caulobacteraceae bacterium]|jgi:drug/metabolite transporter (DMT)-like permease|nr:DMT family transporter [Caulobacteraceae bacterium]